MAQGARRQYDAITHDRIDSITLSVREELLEWLKTTALKLGSFPNRWLLENEIETLEKLMERWRNDPARYGTALARAFIRCHVHD